MEIIDGQPSESLKRLNFLRAIVYIRGSLKSIDLGKTHDRTKPERLLIEKLENIIKDFLNHIKNRKGLDRFEILKINIVFDKIFVDLDIHMYDMIYNMIVGIPYTSNNYGLK